MGEQSRTQGGGAMDDTLREITLPGGQTVLARVTPTPGAARPGGYGSDDLDIGWAGARRPSWSSWGS
jgi:hypothetical protein